MTEKIKITPEYISQLVPYAKNLVQKTLDVSPMTAEGKNAIVKAVADIIEVNNKFYKSDVAKQLSPIKNIVFTDSPFVMRFASSIAAYMWHCHHSGKQVSINLEDYNCNSPVAKAIIEAAKQATRGILQSIPRFAHAAYYDTNCVEVKNRNSILDEILFNPMYDLLPELTTGDADTCNLKNIYNTVLEQTYGSSDYMILRACKGIVNRIGYIKLDRMVKQNTEVSRDDDFYSVDVDELKNLMSLIHSQDAEFGVKFFDTFYSMCQGEFSFTPSELTLLFFLDVIGIQDSRFALANVWREILVNCGDFIMYPDFCMVSERPESMHVDNQQRFTNKQEGDIKFRDGSAIYLSKDVLVPRWIVEHPEQITAEKIINCINVEQKCLMLDIFTPQRFILATNLQPFFKENTNELYRIDMDGGEPWIIFKLTRSVYEYEYWLRVSPKCKTVKDAMEFIDTRCYGHYE